MTVLPPIENTCTIADVRQWVREVAATLPADFADESAEGLRELLWERKYDPISDAEIGALVILSEKVGQDEESRNAWLAVVMPLLGLPVRFHGIVELNIGRGTVRFNGRRR